jgi:hypothetical protein
MSQRGELRNDFSWSKSRDSLFNSCLRAYYYHYYGSWNGWKYDAPADVRELYVMKNLSSLGTWRGGAVHDVVRQIVEGLAQEKPLPVERALSLLRERMLRDYEDSRTGRYRRRPNRICGLQEHYYEVPVNGEALREVLVAAEGSVKRVYGTRTYQTMLQLGPSSIVEWEQLQSITLAGQRVWVSPDVMLRDPEGGMTIVDWKTGTSSPGGETRLQLGIYGLYAVREHDASPQSLVGVEENLGLGEGHIYPLKDWVLEEARKYAEDSIHRMQALLHDRERNAALLRDFPMTDELAQCMRCRFRRACDRG